MAKGTEARRSGRALLERGALSTLVPREWRALCGILGEEGDARTRTVRVNVARSESLSEELAAIRFPCGVWWTLGTSVAWVGGGTAQSCGALRFRYGSQGVSRTLLCDLASGEYQIPSCETLYVDAVRYTPGSNEAAVTATGLDLTTEVLAEISDGASADFTPMLVTAPSSWGAGGVDASASVAVPPGAYAYDLYPDAATGADNVFEVSPPGAKRNFAAGLLQPYGPLPVVSSTVTVQARGAAPVSARIVFFVR